MTPEKLTAPQKRALLLITRHTLWRRSGGWGCRGGTISIQQTTANKLIKRGLATTSNFGGLHLMPTEQGAALATEWRAKAKQVAAARRGVPARDAEARP
ncbi:hypothetical protein [Ancylobacter terrae]|uniref:hypothetical protein n=1 Tax=Ancylobacter sp. sgz301288 TaxID=3342077 RepID=UPI00385F21B6